MTYDQETIDLETALDDLIDNIPMKIDNTYKLITIAELVSKNLSKHPVSKSRDAETMNSKRAFLHLATKAGIHIQESARFIGLDRSTAIYHMDAMKQMIDYVEKVKQLEA